MLHGLDYDDLVKQINDFCYSIGAPADFDIDAMINHEEYADMTVGMLIFEVEDDSYLADFNEYFVDLMRENALYELILGNNAADIKDIVEEVIDTIFDSVSISFTTDSTGMLISIDLAADKLSYSEDDIEVTITVDVSIVVNEKINVTWSDIIAEFEDIMVYPSDDMFESEEDVSYDYDWGYSGTVMYKGERYSYQDAVYFYAYKTLYDKFALITIAPECGNWMNYNIQYAQASYLAVMAMIEVDGREVALIIDYYSGEVVELVNTETGFIAIYEDGTSKTIEFAPPVGIDFAKPYMDLYFQIFENAEGNITYEGPAVHYYYNKLFVL